MKFMIINISILSHWMIGSCTAYSILSSFTQRHQHQQQQIAQQRRVGTSGGGGMTMYDNNRDQPNQPEQNAWAVIATTERWIADTLKTNNQLAGSSSSSSSSSNSNSGGLNSNPYARKEVSYYCETNKESPMIVAGIFRMLKEARERGENHGQTEQDRYEQIGSAEYSPKTMRQTQVVVVPGNQQYAESFTLFDQLINRINQARREARDYITDAMLEKIAESTDEYGRMIGSSSSRSSGNNKNYQDGDDEKEWSVAINCAHLHPKFGEQPNTTPESSTSVQPEVEEEVDEHLEQYKKARLLARRSPYPTVVLEVRATPPPDFGGAGTSSSSSSPYRSSSSSTSNSYVGSGEEKVTMADVQRLEALFGKSAHLSSPDESSSSATNNMSTTDEPFWNSIGKSLTEISAITPLKMAQNWLTQYDPSIVKDDKEHTAFTESSTMHVDAAYEIVFTNIAMMTQDQVDECRYYLVLPHYLSSAATSFEKFNKQVDQLIECLSDDLNGTITTQTFHPEHIDSMKRSPVPIFELQWKKFK